MRYVWCYLFIVLLTQSYLELIVEVIPEGE